MWLINPSEAFGASVSIRFTISLSLKVGFDHGRFFSGRLNDHPSVSVGILRNDGLAMSINAYSVLAIFNIAIMVPAHPTTGYILRRFVRKDEA